MRSKRTEECQSALLTVREELRRTASRPPPACGAEILFGSRGRKRLAGGPRLGGKCDSLALGFAFHLNRNRGFVVEGFFSPSMFSGRLKQRLHHTISGNLGASGDDCFHRG